MSILTADDRKKLKDSDFAVPSERKYPIHNIDHARNALSRVSQNGSPAEKKQVRAAVHKRYPALGHDESKEDPKEEASETPAQEKKEDMDESQAKIQKMFKKG